MMRENGRSMDDERENCVCVCVCERVEIFMALWTEGEGLSVRKDSDLFQVCDPQQVQ